MAHPRSLFILLFICIQPWIAALGETPKITLAGSSTVTRVLMLYKSGIEQAQDIEIRLLPTGSGRGLAELAAGRADAAMLSGPVDYLLARVNAVAPTTLRVEQLDQLKLAATPKSDIVTLLHPSNPVRRLSVVQLQGILTGEITNWSAIGGPNRPIVLILPDELDGVRATIATALIQGRTFVSTARIVEKLGDIPPLVEADPGAIGLVGRVALTPTSTWAEIDPILNVPLYIVARRDRLEEDAKLERLLNSLHSRAR